MTQGATVFLSYAHVDDDDDRGVVVSLKSKLEAELQRLTGNAWVVFVDRRGISLGQQWKKVLGSTVAAAGFFTFLVSPSYFQSKECRAELEAFLARQNDLGRDDLVFPLKWIEPRAGQKNDALGAIADKHQFADLTDLRNLDLNAPSWREMITLIASGIVAAADRGTPLTLATLGRLLDEVDLAEIEYRAAKLGAYAYSSLARLHQQPFLLLNEQLVVAGIESVEEARELMPEFRDIGLQAIPALASLQSTGQPFAAVAEDVLVIGAGLWASAHNHTPIRWRNFFAPQLASYLSEVSEANAAK